MADNSAKESANSSKFSIIENSGMLEDPGREGVSIWCAEDIKNDPDSAHRRFIREQAKSKIDKIIYEKIDNLEKSISQVTDDTFEKMLQTRQLEREEFVVVSHRRRRRKETDYADNRLDHFMDIQIKRIADRLNHSIVEHRISAIKASALIKHLIEAEARLSAKMAQGVDAFDVLFDKFIERSVSESNIARKKIQDIRVWVVNHRRQITIAASAAMITAASSSLIAEGLTAYEYMYNGKTLGIVKNQQDVYNTIEIIGDKLTCAYGAEIAIDKDRDISFRKTTKFGKQLDGIDDVLSRFTYMRDMNATAYAIKVDGQQKAVLYSRKCAEKILNEITENFLVDNPAIVYETIGFSENVEIAEVNTKIGLIQQEEMVLDYMLTGAVEIKTYGIQSGDTFSEIAKSKGMSMEELMAANPGINPEKLQIDQELILNRVCPVVTVQTTEIAEYIAPIEHEIVYEETSTLYKGEQTVKLAGKNGEKQVVARIVRNNGEEINRNELSAKVIKEPTDQVVLKGTKEPPPLIGTGKFIYPTRGRLTSRFGTRWGRMHNGIDLAAPTGTKIRAADGGVVISAGWEGSLGYCIRINHGQNKSTVYGHCSKLFVKKGDKVYQDQHIANIGSTGRSTGPHLHFEVHINGVPQNPLKYLP